MNNLFFPLNSYYFRINSIHSFGGIFLIFILSSFFTHKLTAQTWTGATNTDWQTASNWNNNAVPTASGDVSIPSTKNQPVVNAAVLAKSVLVQTNASLTINLTGTLTISTSSFNGLSNNGTVLNNGTLAIDQTMGHAINEESGSSFTNQGIVRIGANANIAGHGIVINTNALFSNEISGSITLDMINGDAINNAYIFTNKGTITIGGTAYIGRNGIVNTFSFNNQSGSINIDRTSNDGIYNLNNFANRAVINVGSNNSIGGNGITNDHATFTNEVGTININHTAFDGIQNSSGATFTNQAFLNIGKLSNVNRFGIFNIGVFNNENGLLNIDRTLGNDAILNAPSSNFTNKALIYIGSVVGVNTGIENNAIFTNESGFIYIIKTNIYGINILSAALLTNKGQINIGINGFINRDGLLNRGQCVNTNTGVINIAQTFGNGIQTEGLFTNQGVLNISPLPNPGANGIANFANPSAATFINDACGVIDMVENLFNNSSFTNFGHLRINTLQLHDNSALTNNGIIEYPMGNPLSNVINNDFIVKPVNGSCTLKNVLQKGGALSFTAAPVWYKDPALTQPAGNYDQATNAFTSTTLLSGANTLYFNISDDNNGCSRQVSIKINFSNTAPSVVLTAPTNNTVGITNITLSADATDPEGSIARVNFYTVYPGGRGFSPTRILIGSVSQPPYSFNWTNIPGGSYLVQAEAVDDCGLKTSSAAVNVRILETFSVLLYSSALGRGFVPGSNILLEASVNSFTSRTVTKVEFFKNDTKIGEDFTAPYSYLWTNVPAGSFAIKAVATDNLGDVWSSALSFLISTSGASGGGSDAVSSTTFNISPNPTTGYVAVKNIILEEGNYELNIVNVLGQKILTKQMAYSEGTYYETLDLSALYKGIYMAHLKNEKGKTVAVQKLIIE